MSRSQAETNFAILTKKYWSGNPSVTRLARELIATVDEGDTTAKFDARLAHILRHHDESDGHIGWRDTYLRDGYDYLLSYYALMEIASLLRLVPHPLPAQFRGTALRQLSHPAVKKYYERNYPLLLPTMLRYRLEGRWNERLKATPREAALFSLFLQVSLPIDFDRNVETFLWFLDGGWRAGYDIDDVVAALKSFQKYVKHVSKTRRPSSGDRAVQGMNTYLDLCRQLLSVLEHTERPLLQSAFWHWHGYWLGAMRQRMRDHVSVAIDLVSRWSGSSVHSEMTSEENEALSHAAESRSDLLRTVRVLTSGQYGAALRAAATSVRKTPILHT
jgi:hypothetical protein